MSLFGRLGTNVSLVKMVINNKPMHVSSVSSRRLLPCRLCATFSSIYWCFQPSKPTSLRTASQTGGARHKPSTQEQSIRTLILILAIYSNVICFAKQWLISYMRSAPANMGLHSQSTGAPCCAHYQNAQRPPIPCYFMLIRKRACNASQSRKYVETRGNMSIQSEGMMYCLCEAKVLSTSGHGCVESFAKVFVGLIFGKIKFYSDVSGILKKKLGTV